jgi:hypothetical protein
VLTRYRILQKNSRGRWLPIGAVYDRLFDSGNVYAMPIAGPDEDKVNWRDWQAIDRKAKEFGIFGPPLEEYHKVFAGHADRYCLSDQIYTIEGESYREIRAKLYERYVLGRPWAEEGLEQPAVTYPVPADRPFAETHVVRERKHLEQGEEDK